MSLIVRAAQFANKAHAGQVRKYTGQPYITHPARVASMVCLHGIASDETVAAAWLHDVVEDCGVSLGEITTGFGLEVMRLVEELTNGSVLLGLKEQGVPRAERKRRDMDRLKHASQDAKVIKLMDRLDNLTEFATTDDQKFARLYADETDALLLVIGDADLELASAIRERLSAMRSTLAVLGQLTKRSPSPAVCP